MDWTRPRQPGTHQISGPGRKDEECSLHSCADAALPEDMMQCHLKVIVQKLCFIDEVFFNALQLCRSVLDD